MTQAWTADGKQAIIINGPISKDMIVDTPEDDKDIWELAKNCTYGNADCPKCNGRKANDK